MIRIFLYNFLHREFVTQLSRRFKHPFLNRQIWKGFKESIIIKFWNKIICIIKHLWRTFLQNLSSRFQDFSEKVLNIKIWPKIIVGVTLRKGSFSSSKSRSQIQDVSSLAFYRRRSSLILNFWVNQYKTISISQRKTQCILSRKNLIRYYWSSPGYFGCLHNFTTKC